MGLDVFFGFLNIKSLNLKLCKDFLTSFVLFYLQFNFL